MEQVRRRIVPAIEKLHFDRSAAALANNLSGAEKLSVNLKEDEDGTNTNTHTTQSLKHKSSARICPENQSRMSYNFPLIIAVFVAVFALAIGCVWLYYQGHFNILEAESKRLKDRNEECQRTSSKIHEELFQLKLENREYKIKEEYHKEETKQLKQQNQALNAEVIELRKAEIKSSYQLNLTVAELQRQYQEEVRKQKEEHQSNMQKQKSESMDEYKLEMSSVFEFIHCLTKDDSLPIIGVFQRLFRAVTGGSNVDRCRHLMRNQFLLN